MWIARVDDDVVARAADDAILMIEGNIYFPRESLTPAALEVSPTPYTCPWKGAATYYDVTTPSGHRVEDGAWSYEEPYPSAAQMAGGDFARFVAFDSAQVDVQHS